jgi:hypothetical protein
MQYIPSYLWYFLSIFLTKEIKEEKIQNLNLLMW